MSKTRVINPVAEVLNKEEGHGIEESALCYGQPRITNPIP